MRLQGRNGLKRLWMISPSSRRWSLPVQPSMRSRIFRLSRPKSASRSLALDVVADVLAVELDEGVRVVLGRQVPPYAGPLVGLAGPSGPRFSTTSTSASGFFSLAAVAAARPPMPPPITRMSAGSTRPSCSSAVIAYLHRIGEAALHDRRVRQVPVGRDLDGLVLAADLAQVAVDAVLWVRDTGAWPRRPSGHVREARQVAGIAAGTGLEVGETAFIPGRSSGPAGRLPRRRRPTPETKGLEALEYCCEW